MTRRVLSLLLTLTMISMFPVMTGNAQTATATIVGTVLDPQAR